MKEISIRDTRNNIADLVTRVNLNGEIFVITKFGKPKAIIAPMDSTVNISSEKRKKVLDDAFGMWKDKKISYKRKNSRYENIFN